MRASSRFPKHLRSITVAGLVVALLGASATASVRSEAAARASAYIVDRGLLASGSADGVGEALVAVAAGGYTGSAVDDAFAVIAALGPARAHVQAAYAGRIISGLVAAGADPYTFDGTDYVAILQSFYNPVLGSYGGNFYANMLAVNGALAAGIPLPDAALLYIRLNQCVHGGFSWGTLCVGPTDVDTTSYAICDLIAAGIPVADPTVARAVAFLATTQNADGGFPSAPGGRTNANSTGLALGAIAALGHDPASETWTRPGGNPLSALLAMQTADGGFKYLATDARANDYATVQATPGVAGRPLPVRP